MTWSRVRTDPTQTTTQLLSCLLTLGNCKQQTSLGGHLVLF